VLNAEATQPFSEPLPPSIFPRFGNMDGEVSLISLAQLLRVDPPEPQKLDRLLTHFTVWILAAGDHFLGYRDGYRRQTVGLRPFGLQPGSCRTRKEVWFLRS